MQQLELGSSCLGPPLSLQGSEFAGNSAAGNSVDAPSTQKHGAQGAGRGHDPESVACSSRASLAPRFPHVILLSFLSLTYNDCTKLDKELPHRQIICSDSIRPARNKKLQWLRIKSPPSLSAERGNQSSGSALPALAPPPSQVPSLRADPRPLRTPPLHHSSAPALSPAPHARPAPTRDPLDLLLDVLLTNPNLPIWRTRY